MNPDFGTTGNSVWNQPYIDHLAENFFPNMDAGHLPEHVKPFLDFYPEWIASSKLNNFTGSESFKYRYVSLGTTQALDWWHYYCMANGYRLRMFRGEYPYNRDVLLEGQWTSDRYIDNGPLVRGDSVIISAPFSGTGRTHSEYDSLIEVCNSLDIPVFIDCAWFGTCYDIDIHLKHDCVKMVAFSTTKGLSCGNWRSGIVFTDIDFGSLAIQTEWNHGIHLNVAIGLNLMQNFSPDTLPKKYYESHQAVCSYYDLQQSNTIHIATSEDKKYNSFSRDGMYNRINIRDALKRYKKNGSFTQ